MDLNNPIPGEMGDDEFQDAAQAIVDGISTLIAMQQQQLQLLAVLAQQLGSPKRIVRDANGRALGVETVSQ
jgi:hypothetical protein